MERKLASIQAIKEILPIEGADAIELAVVNGWKVVVAKNVGHRAGDHVVYCEIDSFLPIREEFEFLRKSSYKKMGDREGFRLRTIKLRGQVSQGLILPMSIFGDFGWTAYEGLDVTEKLGIVKYEPPVPAELAGKVKGLFPSFLRRTDEERCLSEETLILTENGEMSIRSICESNYSGRVLSHNILSDEDEWNSINSHSVQSECDDWYEIELEDGAILKATGNHRVWLADLLCYRKVKNLKEGDFVKKTDQNLFFLDI
jgi:RNA ligase (TIGR02306 family)